MGSDSMDFVPVLLAAEAAGLVINCCNRDLGS